MGMLKTFALLTAGCQFVTNAQGQRVASPCLSGKYIPAHMKNGQYYPACWRGSFFVNDGNTKVGEAGTVINVSVWNGRNSKPGQGAADQFAKSVSVGQTLLMDLVFKPYKQVIRNADGSPVMRNDGTPVEVTVPGWQYVSGSRRWIMDSPKVISAEIANGLRYGGQPIPASDFFARPNIDFANPNHQAAWQQWLGLMAARREIVYNGGPYYGYALVEMPQGAIPAPNGAQAGASTAGGRASGQAGTVEYAVDQAVTANYGASTTQGAHGQHYGQHQPTIPQTAPQYGYQQQVIPQQVIPQQAQPTPHYGAQQPIQQNAGYGVHNVI